MNRIHAGAAGLALAIATLATPTLAAPAESLLVEARPTAYVKFADLNLADAAGVARLHARVAGAADKLCIQDGIQPLKQTMAGRACRDAAVAGASDQVKLAIARFGNSHYAAASQVVVSLR